MEHLPLRVVVVFVLAFCQRRFPIYVMLQIVSSQEYSNALFKAYLYSCVHNYFRTLPIQPKYASEPATIGKAKTSGTS